MNPSLVVVLIVVALDAMGLGLIMPVLPALLRSFVPDDQVAAHYGVMISLYALMQVVFAPMLGRLSDVHGRRPVLLASLAGATLDYVIMAAAPVMWVLYIGRIVSGITGATGAVAASTIADATLPAERTRWFGFIGASVGVGLIAGPALGGVLGGISTHAPFIGAAVLNGLSLLLAGGLLRETRQVDGQAKGAQRPNPFTAFRAGGAFGGLATLIAVFFVMQLIGQAPGSLWVIYGEDRFRWDTTMVGVSLAVFGAAHALFQAAVAGPLSAWLGERRTWLLGMAADASGFVLLAFATQGWMAFPVLLLLAAGGVGMPAFQAMLSRRTGEHAQGALQGVLTSLTNMSGIVGPLGFTALYAATRPSWSGWVWIVGAGLYLICAPVVFGSRAVEPQPE